jgi:threonine/homoserine/homoserine lactone efflux protein
MVGAEIEKDSAVPVHTIALFAAAVLPLVITPGPDMLFVMSQGVSGGRSAVLKAVAGVLLGYSVHAVLAAMGVAAIVSASHILFEILRWAGVCYLGYLSARMIRSAMRPGELSVKDAPGRGVCGRGLVSSVLNPKTLLVYFAVLPSFVDPTQGVTMQAAVLSVVFIALCGTVYGAVGLLVASAARRRAFNARGRQYVEGAAGVLLMISAVRVAVG